MIDWLSSWAEQIIVAIIIATIIEMILPSGNNKKYIKAVIGVYILFTIISPILGKITDIDFSNINYNTYFNEGESKQTLAESLTTNNDKAVEEIYVNNLKQDMKTKLEEQGYEVKSIDINIELEEENYGRINTLTIILYKQETNSKSIQNNISVNKIEEVKIGNNINSNEKDNTNISEEEKEEIKEYITSVYEVSSNNIKINE